MPNAVFHIASRRHRQSHSHCGTGAVLRLPLRLDLPNRTLQSGVRQPNSTPAPTSKPPFRPHLPSCPPDLSVEASAKAGAPPRWLRFCIKPPFRRVLHHAFGFVLWRKAQPLFYLTFSCCGRSEFLTWLRFVKSTLVGRTSSQFSSRPSLAPSLLRLSLIAQFSHNPEKPVSALWKVWKVWKLFLRTPASVFSKSNCTSTRVAHLSVSSGLVIGYE